MTLLELNSLLAGAFAARVKSAALVAALRVEWTAPDWQSADAAERASRQVLQGSDLSNVVLRAAVAAYELQVPMRPDSSGDIQAGDVELIDLVGPLLLDAFGGTTQPDTAPM